MDKQKRLNTSVFLVTIALLAVIWISCALSIWTNYSSKLNQSVQQIEEKLRFVQELVKHDVDSVIASMNTIGEVARQFAKSDLQLADIQWDTPLTRTMIVIDPAGIIIADSRPNQPAMGRLVDDREYFLVHTARSDDALYIGPNVRSRVDGAWSLPVSLAIRDRNDGSLVVVVSSAVDPVAWGELILERTRHLDIFLYVTDQDGVVLSTSPFEDAAIGQDIAGLNADRALETPRSGDPLNALRDFLFPEDRFNRSIALNELPISIELRSSNRKIFKDFLDYVIANFAVSFILATIVLFYAFLQYKANVNVQKNRAQLLDSLQASSEGFALFDSEDRLVVSNSVFRDFYETETYKIKEGMTFEEMLQGWLAVGAYPPARGREEAWITERLRQHFAAETSIQQLGDGRWLQVSERHTADGGIVSVRTDITELKNREKELRRSEKRFQDFTKTASDWMWETDADHRVVEFGHSHEVTKVIELENVLGKRREQLALGDTESQKWLDHFEDLENEKPFRDFQYWSKAYRVPSDSSAGENRLVAISGIPVYDEDGTFAGYRGTGRDVTQEYVNSQRIRASEARFRAMFESIRIGIVLSDATGRITAFNPAAQETFGYDENEVLGQNVAMLADEEHRRRHDTYIRNYFTTGEAKLIGKNRELHAVRKNGHVFPVKLSLAEMLIDGKKQFIASIIDISTEKSLEAQLRQSQKLEAVGMMVGGVAHDFNNILGIIIGHLDLASRTVEPDTKLAGQIAKSLNAANRGANLTSRLLSFSRKSVVKTDRVNVNAALSDLHELIQRSLTDNIAVHLELDDQGPQAFVNASDLEDSMVNLCINARDAMPEGGRITISSRSVSLSADEAAGASVPPGTYVVVCVSDTGTGIPEDIRQKIFEPFFTTKDTGRGSGLGLSMVYSFVQRSGGAIRVHSEAGTGTRIELLLPSAGTPKNQEPAEGASGAVASPQPTGSERILVVDDEPDLAEIAQQHLDDLGYSTKVAHGYLEAVDILKGNEKFDLLFSDVVMPGGQNGYQLADIARQLQPDLRICLVSGFTDGMQSGNGDDNASYPVIMKPYSREDLSVEIRRLLDT
ncbi:PAS domain S-box protein [Roseibium sp.]|uniref:PAS domain S-box protein n=1 Tax=Roseibium sp. TaxID=1936156 RepID=UPI003BAC2CB9